MGEESGDRRWVELSLHAIQRMQERGASRAEVQQAVLEGSRKPAKKNRWLYKKRFSSDITWRGETYRYKEVAAVVAEEPDRYVVVTVFVFYVAGGGGS